MKKRLGNLIIIFSVLITWLFWLFIKPTRDIPMISQYSQLLAAIAMVGFALINFISTRHKSLDFLFDGLDKSYIYHKYLSVSVLLMVIVHNITIEVGKKIEIHSGSKMPKDPYAMFGSFSMYLFIALIITAIIAKKLNYERWKNIHKFMLVAYAMGVYHYYGSANYVVFSMDPFSIWLNIINCIGISSAIYSVFLYEKLAFKYQYKVMKLDMVADGTLEITGSSVGPNINFKPGQFAFLKILNNDNKFTSHPFTISQAPKNGELQFTIKSLGDDTKALFNKIKIDDEFVVAGPHGKFDYKKGAKKQIWIAGGIGVTPFRSFMQEGIPKEYSIDFFYAYNNDKEGAYINELEMLACNENLRVHFINSKQKGFLTVDEISTRVIADQPIDIYFCGPKSMRESLRKQFLNSKIEVRKFNYEYFQFK